MVRNKQIKIKLGFGLVFTSLGLLTGCGLGSEESLLPDADITDAQVESVDSAISVVTTPGSPAAFHVRVAWGYLAGKRNWDETWVDWSGSLGVSSGEVALEHLVFFEPRDRPVPSSNPSQVSWKSRTGPHYDGLVMKVMPSTSDAVVHVQTPLLSVDLPTQALAAGLERYEVVDDAGHEVAISSIPDTDCGGFVFGYELPVLRSSGLVFGGRLTTASGKTAGMLRFHANGDKLEGRLLGNENAILARGTGHLDTTAQESTIDLMLNKPDGARFGTIHALFHPPSYSVRGSFEGTLSCD